MNLKNKLKRSPIRKYMARRKKSQTYRMKSYSASVGLHELYMLDSYVKIYSYNLASYV